MSNKIKILSAILVTLLAIAAMLPESDNYYQKAIDLVASEHGVASADLQFQSGSYQNLMLFKTVEVNLLTTNAQSIQAVIKQVPLFDWHLSQYRIVNNH